jgi:hypothetical protein
LDARCSFALDAQASAFPDEELGIEHIGAVRPLRATGCTFSFTASRQINPVCPVNWLFDDMDPTSPLFDEA